MINNDNKKDRNRNLLYLFVHLSIEATLSKLPCSALYFCFDYLNWLIEDEWQFLFEAQIVIPKFYNHAALFCAYFVTAF